MNLANHTPNSENVGIRVDAKLDFASTKNKIFVLVGNSNQLKILNFEFWEWCGN